MHPTVHESVTEKRTADKDSSIVREMCTAVAEACMHECSVNKRYWEYMRDKTCKRLRKVGNNAKTRTDRSIKAKTPTSVVKRDANTTEAEIAAFLDKTEDRL